MLVLVSSQFPPSLRIPSILTSCVVRNSLPSSAPSSHSQTLPSFRGRSRANRTCPHPSGNRSISRALFLLFRSFAETTNVESPAALLPHTIECRPRNPHPESQLTSLHISRPRATGFWPTHPHNGLFTAVCQRHIYSHSTSTDRCRDNEQGSLAIRRTGRRTCWRMEGLQWW